MAKISYNYSLFGFDDFQLIFADSLNLFSCKAEQLAGLFSLDVEKQDVDHSLINEFNYK